MFEKFESIPTLRKDLLDNIAKYIVNNRILNVIYICTHNSRRSQISEVLSREAQMYYGIKNKINFFSGGMEVTEFNQNAVNALKELGADLTFKEHSKVEHKVDDKIYQCFSKVFDDNYNPKENFIAIMTCSDADQNCPNVPGAMKKFSLPYDDPKVYDNREDAVNHYINTCNQIANEIFYIYSKV